MQKEDRRPAADYFGRMKAGNGIVILNGDPDLTISPPREQRQRAPLLQTYRRWPEPGKGGWGIRSTVSAP